jgi:hypothetical protein
MPNILQELIASIISSEPRFSVVSRLKGRSDLLSTIVRIQPDVVITQDTGSEEGFTEEQMATSELSVNVISITENSRAAALYRIRLQRTPLGEPSASGLISTIRMAVGIR